MHRKTIRLDPSGGAYYYEGDTVICAEGALSLGVQGPIEVSVQSALPDGAGWQALIFLRETEGKYPLLLGGKFLEDSYHALWEHCRDLIVNGKVWIKITPIREPQTGQTWRHFKGNIYRIVAVARSSENPEKKVVIYGNGLDIWSRDMEEFLGMRGDEQRFVLA